LFSPFSSRPGRPHFRSSERYCLPLTRLWRHCRCRWLGCRELVTKRLLASIETQDTSSRGAPPPSQFTEDSGRCAIRIWRKEEDLNLRGACTPNSFQVRMVSGYGRPLTSAQDQIQTASGNFCPQTCMVVYRHCCQIAVKDPVVARRTKNRLAARLRPCMRQSEPCLAIASRPESRRSVQM